MDFKILFFTNTFQENQPSHNFRWAKNGKSESVFSSVEARRRHKNPFFTSKSITFGRRRVSVIHLRRLRRIFPSSSVQYSRSHQGRKEHLLTTVCTVQNSTVLSQKEKKIFRCRLNSTLHGKKVKDLFRLWTRNASSSVC